MLVEFGLVFAGDDCGFGAEAVDEGVETDLLLGLRTSGAGGFLRIAPVGDKTQARLAQIFAFNNEQRSMKSR